MLQRNHLSSSIHSRGEFMKTRLALVALVTVLVIGCSNKEEELQQQLSKAKSEQATLQQSITERDKSIEEVMKAINEVYADLEKARSKEGKLAERVGGSEVPPQITNAATKQVLLQNITEIGSALKENRKKISSLQAKVKSLGGQLAGLNTLVANLKQSLQEREQSIALLEAKVQGLEMTVAEKTKAIAEKEVVIEEQRQMMKKAFYVVGTRKELKEKGIITDEGGFLWGLLGSTTVMSSGVDQSLFTAIDKTNDQTIQIQGKIDEILPHRNEEFFATATPSENSSALKITRPEKFWQDNYLVIVLD
jgi:DNA repair exonuclease SbcCD ATPase subunit